MNLIDPSNSAFEEVLSGQSSEFMKSLLVEVGGLIALAEDNEIYPKDINIQEAQTFPCDPAIAARVAAYIAEFIAEVGLRQATGFQVVLEAAKAAWLTMAKDGDGEKIRAMER